MTEVEAIAARIGASGPIRLLINDRWYKAQAPEDVAMPFCVWLESSTEEQRYLNGPTALASATIDIDIVDRMAGLADDIAKQIRLITHGRDAVVDGQAVGEMTITSTDRNIIPPSNAGEVAIYNVSISIEIWFEQSVIAAAKI